MKLGALALGILLAAGLLDAQQVLKTITVSPTFGDLPGTPRLARNTAQDVWLVAWRQADRVLGRMVRSNGSTGPFRTLVSGVSSSARSFDVAYDSFRNRYVLAFENAEGLRFQYYTSGLSRADSATTVPESAGATSAQIISHRNVTWLLWLDSSRFMKGAIVQPGKLSSVQTLVQAPVGKSLVAISASVNPGKDNVLALVLQAEAGNAALLGYHIRPDATLVRNSPLMFQPPAAAFQSGGNSAHADSGAGFAIWTHGSALKYRKLSPAGNFSSPARSLLNAADAGSPDPAIAFDEIGRLFVGVWPRGNEIRAAGWTPAGNVAISQFKVATSQLGIARNPSVSSDPKQGNLLAVWEDQSSQGVNPRFQVRASLFYPGNAGSEVQVIVGDNFFSPQNITIASGTVVAWKNEGFNPHTVTSGTPVSQVGMVFDSGGMNRGQKFSFRFTQPGSIPYFCRVHGVTQSGTIRVIGAESGSAPSGGLE